MAAALAAEAEVEEEAVEQPPSNGGGVVVPTKPKKGKAALLLKRDRVRVEKIFNFRELWFVFGFVCVNDKWDLLIFCYLIFRP